MQKISQQDPCLGGPQTPSPATSTNIHPLPPAPEVGPGPTVALSQIAVPEASPPPGPHPAHLCPARPSPSQPGLTRPLSYPVLPARALQACWSGLFPRAPGLFPCSRRPSQSSAHLLPLAPSRKGLGHAPCLHHFIFFFLNLNSCVGSRPGLFCSLLPAFKPLGNPASDAPNQASFNTAPGTGPVIETKGHSSEKAAKVLDARTSRRVSNALPCPPGWVQNTRFPTCSLAHSPLQAYYPQSCQENQGARIRAGVLIRNHHWR